MDVDMTADVESSVAELNAITETGDCEADHGLADEVLLRWVPDEVARAYREARTRAQFWYA